MPAADVRASQIIRDRRRILNTLKMVYPGWMSGEELYPILVDGNPEYSRTLMVKDCAYLNEKGYLMFRGAAGIEARNISVRHCEFKLTATGTDVADRLAKDPTLEV